MFKSKAQKRKLAELVSQGKLKPATFHEWNKATGNTKLPERIGPSSKPKTIAELRAVAKEKLRK